MVIIETAALIHKFLFFRNEKPLFFIMSIARKRGNIQGALYLERKDKPVNNPNNIGKIGFLIFSSEMKI